MVSTLKDLVLAKRESDAEELRKREAEHQAEMVKTRSDLFAAIKELLGLTMMTALNNADLHEDLEHTGYSLLLGFTYLGVPLFLSAHWERLGTHGKRLSVRLSRRNPDYNPELEDSHPFIDLGEVHGAQYLLSMLDTFTPAS